MAPSHPITAYFVSAVVISGGGLLALADRYWVRRPLLGLFLVIGAVGGFVVTKISPFDFVTGGYYLLGGLIAAGAALALVGYVLAATSHVTWQRIRGRRSPKT